ncbi:rhodanese-like domain-containing protein [Gillisia hiemivivida]|uniref:Rhodanese-like domain-containing protein n=1 Tax=Gillisia hiemivivida TaxID=291190 RepID=A0A5C6ZWH7_9FLAO|nr:rhodanese-like domain-containing protein [Gillisia hiemivivida]TXD95068.1 rhodanese-like domain-containing protein [Gillisia hiemivivida]
MEIIIAATKTCPHRPSLEKLFQEAWLPYRINYFEDHPEIFEKYQLKHSPLLIVDGKVESVGMPEIDIVNDLKARNRDFSEIRISKRDKNHMIPKNIGTEPGVVEVDVTWGSIQSIKAAQSVQTIGELEVYQHHMKGYSIIDARKPDTSDGVTIPGSKNIPYEELIERMDELDENNPSIFFCNGPQCPQSSTAIKNLLDAGYPADRILYYRGGMHDWITLGLPVQKL